MPSSKMSPEHDAERQEAEARCVLLGADPHDVATWRDESVRLFLASKHYAPQLELTSAQTATLHALAGRLPGHVGDTGDLIAFLRDTMNLDVAADGLIEADPLTPEVQALVGDLPIALFHHTASALLPVIAQEGLRIGAQTNHFNTQAGCYLSTLRAGRPVEMYSTISARKHGGDPVAIRVKRRLSELRPDPDDADLAWARGRQFVTPAVPVCDLADPDLFASHGLALVDPCLGVDVEEVLPAPAQEDGLRPRYR